MISIKKELIKICEEIVERNNEPYKESEGGISNHIFDEKGVQMYLGWELTKKLNLFEKKLKLHNLQFEKKIVNKNNKKDYLDIFLFYKGQKIGIEIKFKTKGFNLTKKGSSKKDLKATIEKKEMFNYHFSNHGAETNGQHSFFWDLHRLNYFIRKKEIDLGDQIFITNCSSYWDHKNPSINKKYIIELENGNAKISETKKINNSHKFEMSHGTHLLKKMDPPNWLSVDGISGQKKGLYELIKMQTTSINKGHNLNFDTRVTKGEKEVSKVRADIFFKLKPGEFISFADGNDKRVQFKLQYITKKLPKAKKYSKKDLTRNFKRIHREARSLFGK